MKHSTFLITLTLVVLSGFFGLKVDTSVKGWVSFNEAEASPYRRSVRRTARRTARRTSYRSNYYSATPVYAAPAYSSTVVVAAPATTIAVGSIVSTLPAGCSVMNVNGINYFYCAGSYYVASGNQWVAVAAP